MHLHTQGHSKENISQDNQSLPMYPLAPSKKRLVLFTVSQQVKCKLYDFWIHSNKKV